MLLPVTVLGIQALALVGSAVSFIITAVTAGPLATSLIGLAVMFFIFAAGVGAAARRLASAPVGASGGDRLRAARHRLRLQRHRGPVAGARLLVTAIAVPGFFLPAVVEAYNRALADRRVPGPRRMGRYRILSSERSIRYRPEFCAGYPMATCVLSNSSHCNHPPPLGESVKCAKIAQRQRQNGNLRTLNSCQRCWLGGFRPTAPSVARQRLPAGSLTRAAVTISGRSRPARR